MAKRLNLRIKAIYGLLIIVASVLVLAAIYRYPQRVALAPQSIHHWRQSDCAAITYNFYEQNYPFWQPHIFGLVSDSGQSGQNLTSEIPIYYWLVAQLYEVFGADEHVLRAVNSLLFMGGLILFIFSIWRYSGHLLWALSSGLLLFTPPVLVYYGNNYLTNAPAFGMALGALAWLIFYFKNGRIIYWWLSMLFFLLAGALKLPGLLLFFALITTALVFKSSFPRLNQRSILLSAILVLLPIAAWVFYARTINQELHTVYFSTTIFPIWELSTDDIAYILAEIRKLWLADYGHWSLMLMILLSVVALVWKRQGPDHRWLLILSVLAPGMILYALLQFYTFMQHDYYLINLYILPAVLIAALSSFPKNRLFPSWWFNISLFVILIFNVSYAHQRHELRYQGYRNDVRTEYELLYEGFADWLTHNGVKNSDTIIFVPDNSHTSLYLLKRFGWTTHKMAFKDTSQNIYFNRDSAGVVRSINQGASFLVINNWRDLYDSRSYLEPFCRHLHAKKESIMVFDLKDPEVNFSLPVRQIWDETTEDFEKEVQFPKGEVVEFEGPLEGNTRVFCTGEEFTLTRDRLDVEPGMLVEYRAWIYADPEKKVVPVISSLEPGGIFLEKPQNLAEQKGWRLLMQKLVIDEETANAGIRCFIWNPEGTEVLVDDVRLQLFYPPQDQP